MKEKSPLKVGDRVVAGQEIGLVGNTWSSTGPHLHLTIKERGQAQDPIAALPEVFDDKHLA
jgi:murein DD-endopeptidase MepM/ murein hydrolase activator NlpD